MVTESFKKRAKISSQISFLGAQCSGPAVSLFLDKKIYKILIILLCLLVLYRISVCDVSPP